MSRRKRGGALRHSLIFHVSADAYAAIRRIARDEMGGSLQRTSATLIEEALAARRAREQATSDVEPDPQVPS